MKVFIIDDHEMMQIGLKTWIEKNTDFTVCGTASNLTETQEALKKICNPDILIVDVDLGEETGFDLVKKLLLSNQNLKILMYSMHSESGYILDAKKCGAKGYITKSSDAQIFGTALNKIAAGEEYFDSLFLSKSKLFNEAMKFLTPKENQVFSYILKNFTNNKIAEELGITLHSVEIYVSRIYDKLGVHYRDELIAKYK